ncbi:hypothetical protein HX037_05060 [Ignatzschineria indica]|uniref:hypothetical protein n=1 Tax=Ignatzschineria indica TaxID=472583 RepID=UPI002576976E|nr:hypothetical protein [Ignatzschineria indica]MDM1545251.1 hypothetical protein [Ignatzschineria indica]
MVGSRLSTNSLKNDSTKKAERCRILLSCASQNYVPAVGIINAKPRACTGEKNKIVGSRPSMNSLKNDSTKKAERCRISLSRTSQNYVPAVSIIEAKPRACTGEKNEMVGSRPSNNFLKNDSTKKAERCRILLSRASQNYVPAVGNSQLPAHIV